MRPQRRWTILSPFLFAVCAAWSVRNDARGQTIGLDTNLDPCQVVDDALREAARSTCALISKGYMTPLDHSGSAYKIDARLLTKYPPEGDPTGEICADERVYGQPLYQSGRSGVLVGPDTVLTAAHFVHPTDPGGCLDLWYFVFDYEMQCGICNSTIPPPYENFPGSLVYRCVETVRIGAFDNGADFFLVRLDRPVTDRAPLEVRRIGAPSISDAYGAVHHPLRFPTKVDTLVSFVDISQSPGGLPYANFRGLVIHFGSSGGIVYNLDQGVVETVLRTGSPFLSFVPDAAQECYRVQTNPGLGTSSGGAISDFARHIDASEIAIQHPPQTEVDGGPTYIYGFPPAYQPRVPHISALGAPYANPVVTYRLSAPPLAPAPVPIHIQVNDLPNGPQLTYEIVSASSDPSGDVYTLQPGEHIQLVVRVANKPYTVGVFDEDVTLTNLVNGNQDVLRHHFEVGLTGFSVSDEAPFLVNDPAPPVGATKVYTVSNLHISPVGVRVEAGATWLSIDGVSAPNDGTPVVKILSLAPKGQAGDTAQVTIGVGNLQGVSFPGVHASEVRFLKTVLSPSGTGNTVRAAVLDTDNVPYHWWNHALAIPDGDPEGVYVPLAVPEDFCIADLDVHVSVSEGCGFGGPGGGTWSADQAVVELISPGGDSVLLWDHHPGLGIDETFDDTTNPPPTGELLSTLNDAATKGTWFLRVADDVPGGQAWACPPFSLLFRSAGPTPCGD